MSSTMDIIGPEHQELFALKVYIFGRIFVKLTEFVHLLNNFNLNGFQKKKKKRKEIAELDFVYTLVSTNIDHSVPHLVKMTKAIRSRMSSIMNVIRPELSKLSALELENLPYLTLLTL